MQNRVRLARAAGAILVVAFAGALLVRAFSGIDVGATVAALSRAGRFAPLAFVPFVVAMTLDSVGLVVLSRILGRSVSLARVLPIRVATEALHLTAPAGFVVADSVTATLFATRCDVPLAEGAVLALSRKWLVMRAHALYVALGALVGATILLRASERTFGAGWLPWAVGASALIPLSLSLAMGAGFRGRPAIASLQSALTKMPLPGLRARVLRWRTGAVAVDDHLARIGAARSETWLAAASFFGCWLVESIETAVIVWLVGGPLDLSFAMAAEVGISLLRSIGNVAPAGLGVQDAGYAMLFQAMGLPSHTTAAFVLLKRGKELGFIAIGYGLLFLLRRPAPAVSALPGGRVARTATLWPIFGKDRRTASRQPAI